MEKLKHILSELVSFDTSQKEQKKLCCQHVQSFLKEIGFDVKVFQSDDGEPEALWASMASNGKKEGGIILSGHLDVVPCNESEWDTNPFKLVEKDKKFFARGACDMKGFLACVLEMVSCLKKETVYHPLCLSITFDEETEMNGIRKIKSILQDYAPVWCWVGEPSCMEMIDTHLGWSATEIRIKGMSAHSSSPDKGLSAIEIACDIISYIRSLAEGKKSIPFEKSCFEKPYTLFNIGMIKGGIASNVIADECFFSYEIRPHPGDDVKKINQLIDDYITTNINPKFEKFPETGIVEHVRYEGYPLERWRGLAYRCLSGLLKKEDTQAASYMTEAGFFQNSGIPTIICGPGSIEQAHKDNEFVPIDEIQHCRFLLEKLSNYLTSPQDVPFDVYIEQLNKMEVSV